jgi:myo-inositol-1(or 4)-monophosphatase
MDDLDVARAAASAAADIVRAAGIAGTEFKGNVNPVTAADRDAEAAITRIIQRERPHDGLVAEEGSHAASESGRDWVIDPLDGTVNFVHGIPHCAVSIGLEVDGEATVGVIRDVYRNEEFWAVRGAGAFLNGMPISVSPTAEIGAALVSTGFAYDRQERADDYTRMVNAVLRVAQGLRRMGSVALDLAWVACGRYDGHWEIRLAPWDVAAGLLLVREAGGTTTSSDGGPATHHDIVATNGLIHESLRSVVRRAMGGGGS